MSQTALPMRNFSSFLPGNGVGGAGVHWNGQTWRFRPMAVPTAIAIASLISIRLTRTGLAAR
jgi:hypothetical protein